MREDAKRRQWIMYPGIYCHSFLQGPLTAAEAVSIDCMRLCGKDTNNESTILLMGIPMLKLLPQGSGCFRWAGK